MTDILKAENELNIAEKLNPGPWADHSRFAAKAARIIASKAGLSEEKAYISALIHDIGRRSGVTKFRHGYDGYHYLLSINMNEYAPICISHCYAARDINIDEGFDDHSSGERLFVQNFIAEYDYADYDFLVQLCDLLAMPHGLCRLDERIRDIKSRKPDHNEAFVKDLNHRFELKKYFEAKTGTDIYNLLDV